MAEQEVVTESLTSSTNGTPVRLTTALATGVHTVPAHAVAGKEYIDAVHLKIWNHSTNRRTVELTLAPPDALAPTIALTVKVVVPAEGFAWALQGERFRRFGAGVASIYLKAPFANEIAVSGWVARFEQDVAS